MPGKRNFGAQVIAFACYNDQLTKKEAIKVGKHYYNRTILERTNFHKFEFNEILDWINWIYEKKNIHWSCRTPKNIGICNKEFCRVVKDYYEKFQEIESDFLDIRL